jgi:hypothetical protein
MDGHFVPNITIGPPLRRAVNVPPACHLMVERPDELIPAFAEAGADWISVHQEVCVHLDRTVRLIASHGCKPDVVINPATPVHFLDEVLPLVHHVLGHEWESWIWRPNVHPLFSEKNRDPFTAPRVAPARLSHGSRRWNSPGHGGGRGAPELRFWLPEALSSSTVVLGKVPGNS